MVSSPTLGEQWPLLIELTSNWLPSTVCNADGRGELPYSAYVCMGMGNTLLLWVCVCERVCVLSLVSICISTITFSFLILHLSAPPLPVLFILPIGWASNTQTWILESCCVCYKRRPLIGRHPILCFWISGSSRIYISNMYLVLG